MARTKNTMMSINYTNKWNAYWNDKEIIDNNHSRYYGFLLMLCLLNQNVTQSVFENDVDNFVDSASSFVKKLNVLTKSSERKSKLLEKLPIWFGKTVSPNTIIGLLYIPDVQSPPWLGFYPNKKEVQHAKPPIFDLHRHLKLFDSNIWKDSLFLSCALLPFCANTISQNCQCDSSVALVKIMTYIMKQLEPIKDNQLIDFNDKKHFNKLNRFLKKEVFE